jgi:hypothetical protein
MPFYTLLNKSNDKYLKHPKVGLWYTDNIEEAESMLVAAKDYLKAMKLDTLMEQITIEEVGEQNDNKNGKKVWLETERT